MSSQLDIFSIAPVKRDAMLEARLFIEEHPEALREMVGWIRSDIEAGRRPSVKFCLEMLRRYHMVKPGARSYTVNNSWSGPLTRILRERYPDLRDHLPMRASKWDGQHLHAAGEPER